MESKLQKFNVQEILELSMTQKGMLFHYLENDKQSLYNIQVTFDILGTLDVERLERAFGTVQSNNEVLRSVFEWDKVRNPLQIILRKNELSIEYRDVSSGSSQEIFACVERHLEHDRTAKFNLNRTPIRISLIKTSEKTFVFSITHHHILYDGWSTAILLKELFSTYRQFGDDTSGVANPKESYKAVFLDILKNNDRELSKAYWKKYLESYVIKQVFLIQHTTYRAEEKNKVVFASTSIDGLNRFVSTHKLTKASVIYAAYGILLQKYANTNDIVFGTPVSSRGTVTRGAENVMGNFINTLPLRVNYTSSDTLLDIAKNVNSALITRNQFKCSSYNEVKEVLGLTPKYNLFDSIVVIENYPIDVNAINCNEEIRVQLKDTYGDTGIPIVIHVFFHQELKIEIIYQAELFGAAYVEAFSDHFLTVLNRLLDSPHQEVKRLNYLSSSEKQQLLFKYNQTEADNDHTQTVLDLFGQQVELTPGAEAVVSKDTTLTYRQLDELSNQLAYCLTREYNVQAGDLIGIVMDRSHWALVTILGILKAGGAYVPVDPAYPAARQKSIISDARIKLLVTEMYYVFGIDYYNGNIFTIDAELELGQYPAGGITHLVSPDYLAYVMYTSGSTGQPKGVMIEHRSLFNYIVWAKEQYVTETGAGFPLYTSLSFDLTVTSVFVPLISGNRITIYQESDKHVLIEKVFFDPTADVIKLTPSHLKMIMESDSALNHSLLGDKKLIVGGEKLETRLANEVHKKFSGRMKIYNEYGPTEATVGCMIYEYKPEDSSLSVPVGTPISNTRVYLLDRFLEPVPIGVIAEMYISGTGLARGYLHRKELTCEKFIDHPFMAGERMYKTGDLAVRLPDGNIEFIGRADNQIKIRGFRIELGEIEHQLSLHERVRQAVAVVREHNGEQYLVCYYASESHVDGAELRAFMAAGLPHYMVPATYIHVERIPLTINGKVDLKALPDLAEAESASSLYVAPATQTEQALVTIWQDILGLTKVGIQDDFFALGGNSLSATKLASKIKSGLSVALSLDVIFDQTTIKRLGIFIDNQSKTYLPLIPRVSNPLIPIPLSFAQERLWFIDQISGSLPYHLPLLLEVRGKIDATLFTLAINALVDRHEPLRTVFGSDNGQPYQWVLPEGQWKIDNLEEVSGLSPQQVEVVIRNTVSKPFDLSKDYTLRVTLLQGDGVVEKIIMVIHHIACDEWSAPIFIKELSQVYHSLQSGLPVQFRELPIQYSSYSLWQKTYLSGERLDEGLRYWTNQLKEVQPLNLPTNFARTKTFSHKGANHCFSIGKTSSKCLVDLAHTEGTSVFMTLLAVIKVLLFRLSGQTDICVGTPIANRDQTELEGLVGFFVNTLALRSELNHEQTFLELLKQVKTTTVGAFKHHQIPFEKVIDRVITQRDLSRSPLFQVMFILHNEKSISSITLGNATAVPLAWEPGTAKFELTFEVTQNPEGFEIVINYCTELFSLETIKGFGDCLETLLTSITDTPDGPIGRLPILSGQEERVLSEFNTTQVAYPANQTVVDMFREQVALHPDVVAVVYGEQTMSFQELDRRSSQLARWLIDHGVVCETLVPICLDRSFEMIVGIMGILKAGGAYVPIDPKYPRKRIGFILEDTGAALVLSQEKYLDKVNLKTHVKALALDAETFCKNTLPDPPDTKIKGGQLAYVIYTSGTTGWPKGVMNQHSGLYNRLIWMRDYLNVAADDVFLQKTTFCFDVSVWELLLPLVTGTKMVLAQPNGQRDAEYLQTLIHRHQITTAHFVPSMLSVLLPDIDAGRAKSLRNVICSGEELKAATVTEFRSLLKSTAIHNFYGPTEAAIDVTAIHLQTVTGHVVPIGKPIANTQIHIVNQVGSPQPRGVIGELLIGGIQVARGYLNQPQLTSEKFIPDTLGQGILLYRTGDLARWQADGTLEYVGRIDYQVKIRGYRIELGEIEAALEQVEGITQAVVTATEDAKGGKKLCAYVLAKGSLDRVAVINHLKNKLPEYMVPSVMITLPDLPLSSNGKVDRKKLPDPDAAPLELSAYVPPTNENEQKLARIWQDVLSSERVGLHDNFFDLGGHSLLAMRALSAINQEFATNISISRFFELKTIDEFNKYLEAVAALTHTGNRLGASTIEL